MPYQTVRAGDIKCLSCDGSGKRDCPHCWNKRGENSRCSYCQGTGEIACGNCHGKGRVPTYVTVYEREWERGK